MIIYVFIIGVSYVCIVNPSFIHNDSQNDAMKDQSIPKKDDKTFDTSNGTSKPNVNTSIQDDQDIHPTEKKNPNKQKIIRLDVPQSVQENNYFCVPACVQMVLRYHHIEVSQTQLSKDMHTDSITGTEYVDLANTMNFYLFHKTHIEGNEPGYRVQTLDINDHHAQNQTLFEQRVIHDIASNDPVFTAIDVKHLYPDLYHGNHMIIVIGYAMTHDEIDYYYIIDPSYTIQDDVYGGLKIVERNELYQAIIYNEEPAYIW